MKTFKSFNIQLKLKPGTFIEEIAKDAAELAGMLDSTLYFFHNGIGIDVLPTTTEEEIIFAYYQCVKNQTREVKS